MKLTCASLSRVASGDLSFRAEEDADWTFDGPDGASKHAGIYCRPKVDHSEALAEKFWGEISARRQVQMDEQFGQSRVLLSVNRRVASDVASRKPLIADECCQPPSPASLPLSSSAAEKAELIFSTPRGITLPGGPGISPKDYIEEFLETRTSSVSSMSEAPSKLILVATVEKRKSSCDVVSAQPIVTSPSREQKTNRFLLSADDLLQLGGSLPRNTTLGSLSHSLKLPSSSASLASSSLASTAEGSRDSSDNFSVCSDSDCSSLVEDSGPIAALASSRQTEFSFDVSPSNVVVVETPRRQSCRQAASSAREKCRIYDTEARILEEDMSSLARDLRVLRSYILPS